MQASLSMMEMDDEPEEIKIDNYKPLLNKINENRDLSYFEQHLVSRLVTDKYYFRFNNSKPIRKHRKNLNSLSTIQQYSDTSGQFNYISEIINQKHSDKNFILSQRTSFDSREKVLEKETERASSKDKDLEKDKEKDKVTHQDTYKQIEKTVEHKPFVNESKQLMGLDNFQRTHNIKSYDLPEIKAKINKL